jgi:hypothetical protein
MAGYTTMASMMGGNQATAPIPTQAFNAANFIGTPVPQVGDSKGTTSYASSIGGISPKQVVLVAVALFGIGYVAYHVNFEK